MARHSILRSLPAGLLALGFALGPVPLLAAGVTPAQTATVAISDSSYSPASVTIGVGGTVTWVNNGANVHTASPAPGTSLNFDSGGLGAGQSFSFQFTTPGTYNVTSATDCLNGVSGTGFNCAGGVVNVLPTGATVSTAPAPAAGPSVAPQSNGNSQSPTVNITDSGFSPATVTVKAGGTVTWLDAGSQVHSASAGLGVGPIAPGVVLDTGGMAPGQNSSLVFVNPGTYSYTSATDCLNGNSNPQFSCSQSYTVVVTA